MIVTLHWAVTDANRPIPKGYGRSDHFHPDAMTRRGGEASGEIEAIEVHHLVPRPDEVTRELLLTVT